MKKVYSLYIDNENAIALSLEQSKKKFSLRSYNALTATELKEESLKEKNIFICIEQNYIIDEIIEVPVAIKNKATIKNYILHHLKKSAPQKQLLFNFRKLKKQKEDDVVRYQVDGVDEEAYSQVLSLVQDWNSITSATLSKFSLLSISNKCIQEENYISVYTFAHKIIIIAVENKEIIFSRLSTITSPTPELLQMEMTSEINQTISYIQQQNRETNFTLLALSGSLALNDAVSEQISLLNTIPIAILYPNTLLSDTLNEELQEYILPLGNLFVKKEFLFFPKKLLAKREFNTITKILLILSTLLLLYTGYYTFNAYTKYQTLINKYNTIKQTLLKTIKGTKTLPLPELNKTLVHLEIAKLHLKYHPKDVAIKLAPLIKLLQPIHWNWEYTNNKDIINVKFTKQFQTLTALHAFEKTFQMLFNNINDPMLQKIDSTDYKKIYFETTIKTAVHSTTPQQPGVE